MSSWTPQLLDATALPASGGVAGNDARHGCLVSYHDWRVMRHYYSARFLDAAIRTTISVLQVDAANYCRWWQRRCSTGPRKLHRQHCSTLLVEGARLLAVLRVQRVMGGAAAALCSRGGCLPAVVALVEGQQEGTRLSERSLGPRGACHPQPSMPEERRTLSTASGTSAPSASSVK